MSTLVSSAAGADAAYPGRSAHSARGDLAATSGLPTPYHLADLLRIADETAEDFISGRYDHLVPATGRFPDDERWSHRLYADDDLDMWLISWAPGRSTALHDHAGSLGALTVLSGALRELRWTGSDLRERILRAGDQAAFPLGWVHDVERAPSDDSNTAPMDPTLSVHAYSPPLTAMSYYEPTGRGTLRRTHTELTTTGARSSLSPLLLGNILGAQQRQTNADMVSRVSGSKGAERLIQQRPGSGTSAPGSAKPFAPEGRTR